jgi:hypothetical protein
MTTSSGASPSPSLERVQIKRLSRFALGLTTIAAVPGFLAGWYPIVILLTWIVRQVTGKGSTVDNNWATFLLLSIAIVIGWWLYWTYWLELEGNNRYGKVSWLLSALLNAGGAVFAVSSLVASNTVGLSVVILFWCSIMTVLSVWIWILRAKEERRTL